MPLDEKSVAGRHLEVSSMNSNTPPPLVVDLDGTLVRSDLLVETAFIFLGRRPHQIYKIVAWLFAGRASLKSKLAAEVGLDVSSLPYNQSVLASIVAARAQGRRTYLASASDERLVQAVAEHLNMFDGWYASDGVNNLSRDVKAAKLTEQFGMNGYDYIGNEIADLPVWENAHIRIVVNASSSVEKRLAHKGLAFERLLSSRPSMGGWLKLIRPHQWIKNALIVVPLLTAHQFIVNAYVHAALAFAAFSLCASSVYVLNDLVDIQADRQHPTKKNRPFASGTVPLLSGLALVPLLLSCAFGIGYFVSLSFIGVLATYLVLATAYTFSWKRKMLIDAITLAGLYTIRVIAGGVAIGVPISQWLLGFSMFHFLSLALIKRYSEMAIRFDAGLPDPTNRNYKAGDLPVIASLAASSGYSAVIVFFLYLSSDAVRALYRYPDILWLAGPLLLYWISRMLMLSHRRLMHDDPIIFALKDWVSLAILGLIGVLGFVAL